MKNIYIAVSYVENGESKEERLKVKDDGLWFERVRSVEIEVMRKCDGDEEVEVFKTDKNYDETLGFFTWNDNTAKYAFEALDG